VFAYFLILSKADAQVDNPYHLNGNASQESCNCYTLTPDILWQGGSVWNINKISLNESFDFKFNVFLGCNDAGADGIAFVLQPLSTSIGTNGGGMGYENVSPSVGVLLDTWQNFENNDPAADHIAIHKNGDMNHGPGKNLADPVPALVSGGNIEDCNWHTLRIIWNAATMLLSAEVDGVPRVQATIDMVKDIFYNDPMVFWGFTGATGGASNKQRVCTSLNPGFYFPPGQTTCFPEQVNFIDSSHSFGTIEKWFWNFGDGTTDNSPDPPPHVFPAPGNYDVTLSILGNNGCISDTFKKQVVMGSEPIVRFTYRSPVCDGTPVNFLDSSYVEYGTINNWLWNIGGQTYTSEQPPSMQLSGETQVQLKVETLEGCVSPVTSGMVTSYPVPSVDFQLSDICISQPEIFKAINTNLSAQVSQWYWNFGNGMGRMSISPRQEYVYPKKGNYDVQLTGLTKEGCASAPVMKTLNVYETKAFAGNDTVIAVNQPVMLNGSGGEIYKWTPSSGLSADNIANPIATLNHDAEFVLSASTAAGCSTTDTVKFKVFKGPSFYVPSAFSPNNDGMNDKFKFYAVGMKSIDLFQVYNRYGQVIYSSPDISGGWDGKLHGSDQPSGTYIWMIKGVDLTGIPHFKKGTVTLLR
jgi:gliding motility-associated-like protein